MFDLGSLLVLFALALMTVTPIHFMIMRPWTSIDQIAPAMRNSFKPPVSVPEVDELVRLADNALANDPLILATAAITETYDQA